MYPFFILFDPMQVRLFNGRKSFTWEIMEEPFRPKKTIGVEVGWRVGVEVVCRRLKQSYHFSFFDCTINNELTQTIFGIKKSSSNWHDCALCQNPWQITLCHTTYKSCVLTPRESDFPILSENDFLCLRYGDYDMQCETVNATIIG